MVSSEAQPYRFDWQTAAEEDFVKWLVPTLLVGTDKQTMDDIARLADGWQNVELGVTINGVEVNARHFVESLQKNMTHMTVKAARELLNDHCGLREISELLVDLERSIRHEVERRARKLGVTIERDEEY